MGLSGFGKGNLAVYLFCDRQSAACGKLAGTAATAEDTASCIDQSVPVGAGKAAVDGKLDGFFAESPFQPGAYRMISFISEKFL